MKWERVVRSNLGEGHFTNHEISFLLRVGVSKVRHQFCETSTGEPSQLFMLQTPHEQAFYE